MRTPDAAFRRRLLIEALTVVAAPAPAQTAWLERHGVVTDEIALDFDHGFCMAGQLVEDGLLHPAALPDLRTIDAIFTEMTHDPSPGRWATAALFDDAGWGRAREYARQVLVREGVDASVLPDVSVIR